MFLIIGFSVLLLVAKSSTHEGNSVGLTNHFESSFNSWSHHNFGSAVLPHSSATECRPALTRLKRPELLQYLKLNLGTSTSGTFAAMGKAKFLQTDDHGLVLTCQCKTGKGNSCWLEFDKSLDTFLTNNSTYFYNLNTHRADGSHDLLSSSLITCDNNGMNVVNYTTTTHYACYSYNLHDTNTGLR